MKISTNQKADLKNQIVMCLQSEPEVKKIIIFGSFIHSDTPKDIDIAIFQDKYSENKEFITLGVKYQRRLDELIKQIPIDVIPISPKANHKSFFMKEILKGEIIYEK
ncbi:MAG: nucleotidyltransferase domain-containing protein [Desulfobacterales bacterium]|nr:nucleotidyltransferase domain-containing protein [Desulfobacterales bacterium]